MYMLLSSKLQKEKEYTTRVTVQTKRIKPLHKREHVHTSLMQLGLGPESTGGVDHKKLHTPYRGDTI